MAHTFSHGQNQPVKEKRKQEYLDEATSHMVAFTIGAHPNTCFDNMLGMFTYFPEIVFPDGKFIEGWYVVELEDEVVVNEHGWCELPNGQIIDPTIVQLVPATLPVYYFAGVERSWREVKQLAQKEGVWFPYVRGEGSYGKDGLGHPSYKAAYEAAKRKVFELANATQPPKTMTFLTAQDLEDDQRDAGVHMKIFFVSPEQDEEGKSL